MCGRIVWVWDAKTQQLVQRLDDGRLDKDVRHVMEKNRYNVPPTSHLPVAVKDDAETHFRVARWGFPLGQKPAFNARIESAYESPMWKGLIEKHHCVLPVRGFYEWRRPERTPHFVERPDKEVMLLAGLVGERDVDGRDGVRRERCFAIVTTGPSKSMALLHDRMPVILDEEDVEDWLLGRHTLDLAVPSEVSFYEVGKKVGNTQFDDPCLMDPVASQKRLGEL